MPAERSPKRRKTSSGEETLPKSTQPSQIPLPRSTSDLNLTSSVESRDSRQLQRSSWYSSWSRKAGPMAEVARESIRSAGNTANEAVSAIKDITPRPRSIRSPSLAMTLGKGRASRASLADATTTMVHAEAKSPARKMSKIHPVDSTEVPAIPKIEPQTGTSAMQEPSSIDKSNDTSNDKLAAKEETTAVMQSSEPSQRSSWLGWLAKGDRPASESQIDPATELPPETEDKQGKGAMVGSEATGTPLNRTDDDGLNASRQARKGWLPLWNPDTKPSSVGGEEQTGEASVKAVEKPSGVSNAKSTEQSSNKESVEVPKPIQGSSQIPPLEGLSQSTLPQDSVKASGWAFWSRERRAIDSSTSVDKPHEGEIAISDTPSQNKPRRASVSVPTVRHEAKPEAKKLSSTNKASDELSIQSSDDVSTKSHKKQGSKVDASVVKAEAPKAKAIAVEPSDDKKPVSIRSTKAEHNLLLPTLESTLKTSETVPLLMRLASLLYATKEPDLRHLSLTKDPSRIKNALAIGVHGYFPTPLIRSVLGQPTGTSIKFADMAAKSIKRWTNSHGYECQVKTAALEGEGKIAERIELLWKLLLNWIEEIRKSDFIIIACHSQGVPVAIMLVAKLIQFGCVSAARVCICAMAGVNMGPFPEYKSRWIGGSAGELFEFSDSSSRVSEDFVAALDIVLKFGVRLTFIGSIDDQLVSLESSLFSPISHPHIFRAVSIDSRIHAPNFLSHLVGFALKLRNLGVEDHGLIRELSSPLAGSLYTGEGHSRIYEDDAVYDLAVAFAMETTALVGVPLARKTALAGPSNPYILPFAMRGILEEDFVKNELSGEAADLLKEFDEWKPTSKTLKDVKFRLEGVRSKL